MQSLRTKFAISFNWGKITAIAPFVSFYLWTLKAKLYKILSPHLIRYSHFNYSFTFSAYHNLNTIYFWIKSIFEKYLIHRLLRKYFAIFFPKIFCFAIYLVILNTMTAEVVDWNFYHFLQCQVWNQNPETWKNFVQDLKRSQKYVTKSRQSL